MREQVSFPPHRNPRMEHFKRTNLGLRPRKRRRPHMVRIRYPTDPRVVVLLPGLDLRQRNGIGRVQLRLDRVSALERGRRPASRRRARKGSEARTIERRRWLASSAGVAASGCGRLASGGGRRGRSLLDVHFRQDVACLAGFDNLAVVVDDLEALDDRSDQGEEKQARRRIVQGERDAAESGDGQVRRREANAERLWRHAVSTCSRFPMKRQMRAHP